MYESLTTATRMSSIGSNRGPPWSVVVPHTSTQAAGSIHRSHIPALIGATALRGSTTLWESFTAQAERTPSNPCLGERLLASSNSQAGPFVFRSYAEVCLAARELASGMMREKLIEQTGDGLRLLGVYMKNCSSWIVAEYAAYSQSAATVPLYDTLGPDTVEFIIDQTQLTTLVCTLSELGVLEELKKKGKCPSLKSVILTAYSVEPLVPQTPNGCGLTVYTLTQLRKLGTSYPCHPRPPKSPSCLATLCYTSGTTGVPKGAMITHLNLVATANSGLSSCFGDLSSSDLYLSFLPLPHIFERIVISALLASGAAIGFSRGNPLLIVEDCVSLRPTIFCAVPRLLNRIHDKIEQISTSATGAKGMMLRAALRDKLLGFRKRGLVSHTLWDALIMNKLKVGLGLDKVRRIISGGAPLPSATMEFFRILIGSSGTVHEGYGQTETTGGTTITYEEDLTVTGHVGGPLPVCEIKLVDVPDMGYLHTDTVHNQVLRCDGRGEICVRGPGVFQGYFKDPVSTAEALDADGWLHTGDVGMWTPFGQLAIIDRKKNLLKLSQGEYVAVEKVENVLGRASLIAQIFVHGDSTQNSIVAIVVPDEEVAKSAGLAGPEESSDLLRERIMEQINSLSKEGGLHGYETVKAVFVEPPRVSSLWTPENNLLTPTFKLKRQELRTKYATHIEALYKSLQEGQRSKL